MIRIIKGDGKTELEAIAALSNRDFAPNPEIERMVKEILDDVKLRGDAAVQEYSAKFDGIVPDKLSLGGAEMKAAYESIPDALRKALLSASKNIRSYHERQLSHGYEMRDQQGNVLGQIVRGLSVVGLYVPGGTASYASTVLMNAIPAKLAGVERLIVLTPPGVPDPILAAAFIAGVDEIIPVGGAQAIAGLAYGTQSIPKADKIVGPGNIFVATAKRLVSGHTDIDMIAGPSEILVIADASANPDFIAADLLSQAEHDSQSASILLTTEEELASRVSSAIGKQLAELPRREIAEESIAKNGLVVICRSIDEALTLADIIAPEHLELMTEAPMELLRRVRNAGSVFLGHWSPEPLGDYYAGTNHVLPTSGTARFASPLGVYDFVKRMSYTMYTKDALAAAKDDIIEIGTAEGLTAHCRAVEIRFGQTEETR
jgi:histidinol dehydrogenase